MIELGCGGCDRSLVVKVRVEEGTLIVTKHPDLNDCSCPYTPAELWEILEEVYHYENLDG